MKIWLTIAECMGTDNEFTTDVYAMTSAQEAGNHASALIADMMVTMGIDEDIDVTSNWELEGDGWFYRVRIEEHEIGDVALEPKNNLKTFAMNIEWDTDDECYDDEEDDDMLELPSWVEIPADVDEDDIADYLSDVFGFCVIGFEIEHAQQTKK
jgi:hypothetical protein